jgi:LAO/AO transport system kinase
VSDSGVRELVERARAGDARAVARLVSLIEDGAPALREAMALLAPHTGHARVVGLTGAPGVGKSTTVTALVGALRARSDRVGVLAVDPSSPFSGGALLGDRVRMQEHATDPDVFIRSMASRGHLGGLSAATPQALRVLDAAGFDVVLIETVGVGQSEVEVARTADTVVVMVAPGMGDGIQAAKAGILEIGDIYVVNKADREGAETTARELRHMLSMGPKRSPGEWSRPVLRTVADTGEGIADIGAALDEHHDWLVASGELNRRRVTRAAGEIEALAFAALRGRLGSAGSDDGRLSDVARRVADGSLDPYGAADELVADLTHWGLASG